jgi:hypothetical protein
MNTQLITTAVKLSSALLFLALFVSSCGQDMTGTADNSIQSSAVSSTTNAEGGNACDPGTFSPDGLSPCEPAPKGTFVADFGATEATPCPVGRYQDEVGQTSCKLAPAGSYVDQPGSEQAISCPAGTFQSLEGQTSCNEAPAGFFVAVAGAIQATACPAGKYQPETGQTSCIDAPEGSFVGVTGAAQATLCPVGTFSDFTGASACTTCDAGFTTTGPGATFCVLEVNNPTTKDDCKKGGWKDFDFKNQGQCVRFVETGKDSR